MKVEGGRMNEEPAGLSRGKGGEDDASVGWSEMVARAVRPGVPAAGRPAGKVPRRIRRRLARRHRPRHVSEGAAALSGLRKRVRHDDAD